MVAYPILQCQFLRPAVEAHRLKHPHSLCHRERSEREPRHHGSRSRIFSAHFDILVPPLLGQTLVQKDGLLFFNSAPIAPSSRKQQRAKDTELATPTCNFM